MSDDQRYVAVSTDGSDRQVYSGPTVGPVPDAPEGRQWLPEYRAMAAGYWYPTPYAPEPWGVIEDPPTAAVKIQAALKRHLLLSTDFLRTSKDVPLTSVTLIDVIKATMRQERALNLVLRAMLEVFNVDPPTYVDSEAGNGGGTS